MKKRVSTWVKVQIGQLKTLKLKNIIILVVAGFINSIGVVLLLSPSSLIDGGLSGTSMLLSTLTPLSLSIYLLILNIPFYLFALKKEGIVFIFYSLIAICAYSFFSFMWNNLIIPNGLLGKFYPITTNLVLASVFGGLISGIGSGLTIRSGGSLDGVEVMAVLYHKKVGLSVGQFVMIYNVILYIIAGFIITFEVPLFSIIAYVIGIKAVDGIVEGLDKAKSLMIITKKGEEIAKEISEKFGKGITILNGRGYFSNTDKEIIYYVVNRFQVTKLKQVIKAVDETAFISITDVSEVIGTNTIKKK